MCKSACVFLWSRRSTLNQGQTAGARTRVFSSFEEPLTLKPGLSVKGGSPVDMY